MKKAKSKNCTWEMECQFGGYRPECAKEILVVYQYRPVCPFCNKPIKVKAFKL